MVTKGVKNERALIRAARDVENLSCADGAYSLIEELADALEKRLPPVERTLLDTLRELRYLGEIGQVAVHDKRCPRKGPASPKFELGPSLDEIDQTMKEAPAAIALVSEMLDTLKKIAREDLPSEMSVLKRKHLETIYDLNFAEIIEVACDDMIKSTRAVVAKAEEKK